MKKLLSVLALFTFLFSGCSKQDTVKYDLNICDSALTDMCDYLESFENDIYKVEKTEFSEEQLNGLIVSLKEEPESLNSITIYSQNISNELAVTFIEFAAENNIPVTFALSDIESETLLTYDKAFCITTDYSHAAEEMALRIKELWSLEAINDVDSNQIFSFSVIKEETSDDTVDLFYSKLTENLELYGIPMQINSTLSPSELNSDEILEELREKNEGYVVLADSLTPYYDQYPPAGDGVEIISLQRGTANAVKDLPFVTSCFVDYKNYKLVADEISDGFNDKEFPLQDVLFPYIERTVYIPATVI